MKGGLADSKIRLESSYSVNDWRRLAEQFEKHAPYGRPNIRASLITTLLLSLGLWAGIWGVVALIGFGPVGIAWILELCPRNLREAGDVFLIKCPMHIHTGLVACAWPGE
jgi:hypothetical protein